MSYYATTDFRREREQRLNERESINDSIIFPDLIDVQIDEVPKHKANKSRRMAQSMESLERDELSMESESEDFPGWAGVEGFYT